MKKGLILTVVGIILAFLGGLIGYGVSEAKDSIIENDSTKTELTLVKDSAVSITMEDLVKQDKEYMDSIPLLKNYIFFESRVVLAQPFNECDSPVISEVTNVFQTNVEENTDINTTVYMFIHDVATGETQIEIHENAFITDDIELDIDSIKIPFVKAFELARQSNYPPSRSKYITLRHGFGRYACNPFYTIGNTEKGHLWVDAITGEVMDTDPATKEK